MPSIVDRDPVVVAIGTEGTAPILGQGLRARIDAMLPPALGDLARAAAALRDRVAATIPAGNRRRGFWYAFFFGDVRDAFIAGESCNYLAGVENLFASEAQPAEGPRLLRQRLARTIRNSSPSRRSASCMRPM